MVLFTEEGEVLWQCNLGGGVVPGMWFCPVFPFDLDGDGVDEIWFVNNPDADHPLGVSKYRLERLDARTGETTGFWPWPNAAATRRQCLSHGFRNVIVGGHVNGEPVLVTVQGTYGDMYFQGWTPEMRERWTHHISQAAPGARGSHMCPITDLDQDGIDELMWGERCVELDRGTEVFCADRDTYRGHSDVIQPVLDWKTNRWFLYTCRESDPSASPRVVLFDHKGERVWGDLTHGHIDMGWVARLGENNAPVAMAIRIGEKTAGPAGFRHGRIEQFAFNAMDGKRLSMPFDTYGTIPVDLDGDGYH